ncbi:hypothetical protein BS47DRAFT_747322 [Hydnum rufescens UP504]|uniref:Uncharacterized protein n=1 Tax=Hydnum rufescens UP504 TaxID=1448309 RepID=A0A9P6ADM4_9AGAM|nr:hypothetical protein BS47DRAFT_747322 [Hydnum rufescens UP504]
MSESEPESNPSSSTTTETPSETADSNSEATPEAEIDLNLTNPALTDPVTSTTSEPTEVFTHPRGFLPPRGSGRGTSGSNTLRSPLVGGSAVPIPPSLQPNLLRWHRVGLVRLVHPSLQVSELRTG